MLCPGEAGAHLQDRRTFQDRDPRPNQKNTQISTYVHYYTYAWFEHVVLSQITLELCYRRRAILARVFCSSTCKCAGKASAVHTQSRFGVVQEGKLLEV